MRESLFSLLKEKFGINVNNRALLLQAFMHSSYVNEHKFLNVSDNERLEFLGDAVLEYVISDYLYRNYPQFPEGKLSKMRSSIVCEDSLAQFTRACGLDQFLLLGRGEEVSGGKNRPSILCDLFEAFLGALTLDSGLLTAQKFLAQVIIPKIASGFFEQERDYKTQLQELLQQNGEVKIAYKLINEKGPAHEKEFYVEVSLNKEPIGHGVGKNKKLAEQSAARDALERKKCI